MLFDSHAHLTHASFDRDREEIMKKLHDFNVEIITVGNGLNDSEKAVNLAKQYPNQIWASVGFHPDEAEAADLNFTELKNLAKNENVVAIGECGLDYYRNIGDEKSKIKNQNLQKEIFVRQIKLAQELDKPLILHCRPSAIGSFDAYEDVINIIENLKFKIENYRNGVAHFFSGSKEIAKEFLDLGFYVSFAGPITFSSQYKELVEYVPLDKILVETDAPFAAPRPWRGKRNEPAFVEFVARQIAQWKRFDFDKVAAETHNNATSLFGI